MPYRPGWVCGDTRVRLTFNAGSSENVNTSSWIQRYHSQPEAGVRLFCFHHAGVGAAAYRHWRMTPGDSIEVCAIELPGRGARLREPPIADIPALVAAILPALEPWIDRPYAMFGHSMGGVLAAEVARAFESARRGPSHLMVSARRPAHVPDTQQSLHTLPDRAFVEEIGRRYGGIPPQILADAEVLALLLPALRADVRALELFMPCRRPPLSCPITVFGGLEDRTTSLEQLEAWRTETTGAFDLKLFAGDHFYVESHRDELLREVARALRPLTVAAGVTA